MTPIVLYYRGARIEASAGTATVHAVVYCAGVYTIVRSARVATLESVLAEARRAVRDRLATLPRRSDT